MSGCGALSAAQEGSVIQPPSQLTLLRLPSQHHPCCHRPEDIAAFVARHPGLRYDSALEQYARVARLSPHYRLGTLENILALATMLQARSLQGPLAGCIYTCCRRC